MDKRPYLSIVIPAYNEALRLPKTLDRIESFVKNKNFNIEIIVVIEKGTDNTIEIVKDYESRFDNIKHIANEGKKGKGYSVRTGVLASTGDRVLFTDADMSVPIEEMTKMLVFLETKYDCVIGDRVQIEKQPLYRIIMGVSFRWINKLVSGLKYRDTQCGFKIFNREFAQDVFSNMIIDGFAFDVEMLMIAKKFSYKIKPLKVKWFNDDRSTVDPVRDSIKMFCDLFRIRKSVKGLKAKTRNINK